MKIHLHRNKPKIQIQLPAQTNLHNNKINHRITATRMKHVPKEHT